MVVSWKPRISRIAAVVYDERYSDCRAFASVLVRRGATPFPVSGDCGRLWHGALRAHLLRNRGKVAGLTTDSDFVVSRAYGRELGLRLVYEGAHDSRGSSEVTHRLRRTAYQREIVANLGGDRASWAEMLAQSLLRLPSHDSAASFGAPALLKTPRSSDHPGYLTSWLHEQSA